MCIRQAEEKDISRLAEIEVFNYRLCFYPIFKNDLFYFSELSVPAEMDVYRRNADIVKRTCVYDDGVVKGFIRIDGYEVKKLFVEPALHGQAIGAALLKFAVERYRVTYLWALEKNEAAIRFYKRKGFVLTDRKKPEEGTNEYLVRLERPEE